jgi:DNA replication protein DnaC
MTATGLPQKFLTAPQLQVARRELALEAAIARLDKYHLLILDDLAYITKNQAETSVLFELISGRTSAARPSSLPISGSASGTGSSPIRP